MRTNERKIHIPAVYVLIFDVKCKRGIMNEKWIVFESIISLLEMLTSCFFAAQLFRKEWKGKKDILWLLLFATCGAALLTLRELGILPISDYVPAVVIFGLYAILICKAKIWTAALWAALNYLLIGIVTITINSVISMMLNIPISELWARIDGRILVCSLIRLGQLLLSQVIISVMNRFQRPTNTEQKRISLLVMAVISIAFLMALWNIEFYLTEDLILIFNIAICVLVLVMNFIFLMFREILSKEKYDNKELKEQNRIISMQIRNQNEVNEMYNSIRALKHDMNNHLSTMVNLVKKNEYDKLEEYIESVIGEVAEIEAYQSGNSTIDAVIGSKTALAKKEGIHIELEMAVSEDLYIPAEHLSVVLGNLYDNAIDANLKIGETDKRYINIKILLKGDNLIIYFENAAEGEDSENKSLWLTTKKSSYGHGFGIKNIDRIVQLYDGYCYRELKNNIFTCQIRIPNERK